MSETLQFLWQCAEEILTKEVLNEFLIVQTIRERPPGTWQQISTNQRHYNLYSSVLKENLTKEEHKNS